MVTDNVRVRVFSPAGILLDECWCHNTITAAGLSTLNSLVFSGASTVWSAPWVRIFAGSTSLGGVHALSSARTNNRIRYTDDYTVSAAGTPTVMRMYVGTSSNNYEVANATLSLAQVAIGAIIEVQWDVTFDFNMTGNINNAPSDLYFRAASSASKTGGSQLWGTSHVTAVENTLAKLVIGETNNPSNISGYARVRLYRLDPLAHPNIDSEDWSPISGRVYVYQQPTDVRPVVISGQVAALRNFAWTFPPVAGNVGPSGVEDSQAYRITVWRMTVGNSSGATELPLAAGIFDLPERIPTSGAAISRNTTFSFSDA